MAQGRPVRQIGPERPSSGRLKSGQVNFDKIFFSILIGLFDGAIHIKVNKYEKCKMIMIYIFVIKSDTYLNLRYNS